MAGLVPAIHVFSSARMPVGWKDVDARDKPEHDDRGRYEATAPSMSKLARYLTGRLVKATITVLAVLVMNFVLVRLAPGDPASVMAGEAGAADAKFVAQLREQF